jgi:DNA replication initiation complex subunit (GINS family)
MSKWWLTARHLGDTIGDVIEDAAENVMDAGEDLVKNGKCYQTVTKLRETGTECYQLACDTTELCGTTQTRGNSMMEFGSDITETLRGFSTKMDVETLSTIKDLMDGDRLRQSMQLAQEMDDIALECVAKSMRMIEIMEETMDTVPGPLQNIISKMAGKDDAETVQETERSMEVLSTLDKDLEDVSSCVGELQNLHISNALKVGLQAYENLHAKATLSRSMFDIMSGFATEVSTYTQAINDGDVGDMIKLAAKVKDMWHCLKLAGFMRALAEGVGKIIKVMIELFRSMTDRLSTLWAALAFAKDCMVDCIEHVLQAKNLVVEARDKSQLLVERSTFIADKLKDLGDFNKETLTAAKDLSDGAEIKEAIQLATHMDELILECTGKVIAMVERVTEGLRNLPDIITAEVKVEDEGKHDDDPEPDDIEENLAELDKSREVIESSDIIDSVNAVVSGFRGILDNESNCQNMLSTCEKFTGDADSTIQSFLGVWDLESAMVKISEMCRMVRLGELIKQFAENIKKLLKAIIAWLRSMVEKINIKNLAKIDLGDAVDSIKEHAADIGDKLQFWK